MPHLMISLFVCCFFALVCGCDEDAPEPLPCEPNVPAGIDPAVGASFDPVHMLCVRVTMVPDDYAALAADNRFTTGDEDPWRVFEALFAQCGVPWPNEYDWFRADVDVDGAVIAGAGIRQKGFVGAMFRPNPSLKVKTDKFVQDQLLGDTERVTLNAAWEGGVMPCLVYEIFNAAGMPAPLCNLANVMVNDQPLGPYVHVEAIKKRFLRRAFGDDAGSLYEGTHTDFVVEWLPRWDIKTDDTDPAFAPLLAVARALEVPDDQLVAALEPVLNIDRFITFWALEVLVKHADGYGYDRNNFYVYFDPTDGGRAVFIPWGADKEPSSEWESSLDGFLTAHLPRRFSRIPALATRMDDELVRLLVEVWDEAAILASIDRYQVQVETALSDSRLGSRYDELREWVRGRPARVRELLAAGLPQGSTTSLDCTNSPPK